MARQLNLKLLKNKLKTSVKLNYAFLMDTLFTSTEYKSFLKNTIAAEPSGGRGVRKRLADHIGCQIGYITQVLSGAAHFSQEQAEAAARFFHLTPKETEYFLLLVSHNRAGTQSLQAVYESLLNRRRHDAKLLKSRLEIDGPKRDAYHQTYYSSWQYAAVHMALSVPGLRKPGALAEKLGIPLRRVGAVLNFLVEHELARKEGTEFHPTEQALHLERKSPLISKHHSNWRLKAIQSVEESQKAMHYSGVISCSKKDLARVQEKLAKCLEECIEIVKKSPAEDLAVLNIDLFSLGRE